MTTAFKLGKRSRDNLVGVHHDLVAVVQLTLMESPIDFVVIEGRRSVERQKELVASGASQTMNSRHLTGHAVDLAAWVGQIRWDMGLYYQIAAAAQRACKTTGTPIRWGGAWARLDNTRLSPEQLVADYVAKRKAAGLPAFIDAPHIELPSSIYP